MLTLVLLASAKFRLLMPCRTAPEGAPESAQGLPFAGPKPRPRPRPGPAGHRGLESLSLPAAAAAADSGGAFPGSKPDAWASVVELPFSGGRRRDRDNDRRPADWASTVGIARAGPCGQSGALFELIWAAATAVRASIRARANGDAHGDADGARDGDAA